MNTKKPPRVVGSNLARIDMAQILADTRHGLASGITRHGKLAAWIIPITCEHCHVVIRATVSGDWEDLERGTTCPVGARHEPDTAPPTPHTDQEPR